jgi:uncharacterized Zn finger protein
MYGKIWHSRHNLNYRLKTKFRRKLIAFEKKNPDITPFKIDSNTLASNWWAKAWNAHLKSHNFNSLQLEKGKLYFRCEALADLKIRNNQITGTVLGSNIEPYYSKITINPITKTKWLKITKLYEGHLELFEKVLDHQFPKELSEVFTNKSLGLFPTTKEITFECSCPSRLNLCKHTAVVLFAFGAKIDLDPQILFELRGVDFLKFMATSINKERLNLLKKTRKKNPKILEDTNLSELFNIDIQE